MTLFISFAEGIFCEQKQKTAQVFRKNKSPTKIGLFYYSRIETSKTFAAVESAIISYSDHI